MGYTTKFTGKFKLSRKLTNEECETLVKFSDERHGGNMDVYGGYPGFWCQWVPSADSKHIVWDGGEKFYHYVEWLHLILDRYLEPWGVTATGKVKWLGEDRGDRGTIELNESIMTVTRKESPR
jgi:hypothetical protein